MPPYSIFLNILSNDVPKKQSKFRTSARMFIAVSFVANEFSQIADREPKLTTYLYKRGEQLRNE